MLVGLAWVCSSAWRSKRSNRVAFCVWRVGYLRGSVYMNVMWVLWGCLVMWVWLSVLCEVIALGNIRAACWKRSERVAFCVCGVYWMYGCY